MRLLDRILFRLRKIFGREEQNMTALKGLVEADDEKYIRAAEYFEMLAQINGWNEKKIKEDKDV